MVHIIHSFIKAWYKFMPDVNRRLGYASDARCLYLLKIILLSSKMRCYLERLGLLKKRYPHSSEGPSCSLHISHQLPKSGRTCSAEQSKLSILHKPTVPERNANWEFMYFKIIQAYFDLDSLVTWRNSYQDCK